MDISLEKKEEGREVNHDNTYIKGTKSYTWEEVTLGLLGKISRSVYATGEAPTHSVLSSNFYGQSATFTRILVIQSK